MQCRRPLWIIGPLGQAVHVIGTFSRNVSKKTVVIVRYGARFGHALTKRLPVIVARQCRIVPSVERGRLIEHNDPADCISDYAGPLVVRKLSIAWEPATWNLLIIKQI